MTAKHHAKIVVKTTLSFESHKGGRMVAAHLDTLGLTAYGYTREDARDNVKGLFHTWVSWLRRLNILEERLGEMRVEWWEFDDYDGSLPVEDTTPSAHATAEPSASPNALTTETMPMAIAA